MKPNQIYQGDWIEVMQKWPDQCVDMVMTSPPYWALRDYGTEGQLGLEPTFEEYIDKLCSGFDEVKRVLKDEGTIFVNMGDTYASGGTGSSKALENEFGKKFVFGNRKPDNVLNDHASNKRKKPTNLPTKSLVQIPFRFSIEMVNRGWRLRNVLIWHKPNPMPASAKDRFTVDFEYLFFFSKKKKYYFERQFEPHKEPWRGKGEHESKNPHNKRLDDKSKQQASFVVKKREYNPQGRNARSVWKIPTQPFPEAHFATYPEKLCITPIKAGCPEQVCTKCGKAREKILEIKYESAGGKSEKEKLDKGNIGNFNISKSNYISKYKRGRAKIKEAKIKNYTKCSCNAPFRKGIVLDPFFGSGTTAVVARKLGRDWAGIELSEEYIKIAEKRLSQKTLGI